MLTPRKIAVVLTIVSSLVACSSFGQKSTVFRDGDNLSTTTDASQVGGKNPIPPRADPIGGTSTGTAGTVSGKTSATRPDEKEKRGNTPPGMDRQGQGPATGAIVDPTGAATRSK